MPLTSQRLFENTIMYLSVLRYIIKSRTKKGLFDLNKQSETFFAELLNKVYDWNLQNLNQLKSNYPAIDLGDPILRVCVQVTAQNDSTKINATIKKFVTNKLFNQYDRLIILIITDKKSYTFTPNTKGKFQFDPQADILDIDDLLEEIESMAISSLTDIHDFLSSELSILKSLFADKSSLLFQTEEVIELPPSNAQKILKHLEYTAEEYEQGRIDIINFYQILTSFPRRTREYLYVIATKGETSSGIGYDATVVQPRAIESFCSLTREESFEEFNILKAKGIADIADDNPLTIGVSFGMDTGVDIIGALKDYCANDEKLHDLLVECDFTALDDKY